VQWAETRSNFDRDPDDPAYLILCIGPDYLPEPNMHLIIAWQAHRIPQVRTVNVLDRLVHSAHRLEPKGEFPAQTARREERQA
jgi:hypothetical protein